MLFTSIIYLLLFSLCAASNVSFPSCCALLDYHFPGHVSYPGSVIYKQEQTGLPYAGYWTPQESDLNPACRYTPTTSKRVARAVALLASQNCSFAVRGGGHTSWAGAANIEAPGLTIDLSKMNGVSVSANHKIVSIGGGARWGSVYGKLDKMGLAIAGGRVFDVGVGGLTTGGGKSFFSSERGFTCDNVVNFEVVTGEGKLLSANSTMHPGLFKALKGGSNNFGIVTRFDFQTFKQGKLWGGQVIYNISTIPHQINALTKFANATSALPYPLPASAEVIVAFVNLGTSKLAANFYTYTLPQVRPPVFHDFFAIKHLLDSTGIFSLAALTKQLDEGTPHGKRALFATLTFSDDSDFLLKLYDLHEQIFAPLLNVSGIMLSFVLQPVSKASLLPGCGHNSLGLCPTKNILVFLSLTVQWELTSDDHRINVAARKLIDEGAALAEKAGVLHPYIYLNYALPDQNPIASYGTKNLAELRAVCKQYDPDQVFQKLVPGGFKLY